MVLKEFVSMLNKETGKRHFLVMVAKRKKMNQHESCRFELPLDEY